VAQCVFCRIASHGIPAAMVLETEQAVSFLDINPVNPGHALVVPRRHASSLLELTDEELHTLITMARRVAAAACGATGSRAFNILQNDGEAAGQVVPHAHLHVIPRSPKDGFSFGWRQLPYGEGELAALQQAVRQRL